MNTKQKEIAENIFKEMKSNDGGDISLSKLIEIVNDHNLSSLIIQLLRDDLCLIDDFGSQRYRLTLDGWEFTSFNDLESEKLNEIKREQFEFEKSKVDFELAKKMLKEYPRTKWIARISIMIGIGLAVLEIIQALAG